MSGSAALSAAKRRRGAANNGNNATEVTNNDTTSNKKNRLDPIQILNQHHMKLDILYARQDKINKILDIDTTEDGVKNVDDKEESIMKRISNIENKLLEDVKIPIDNENDLVKQLHDFTSQLDELKQLILNVQGHSINVSLELVNIKKSMEINDNININHDLSNNIISEDDAN
tara:strand:+ start:20553 stop:21071 length:519 start_codon:yes stop_codon:yes gene_type:complete